MQPLWLVSEFIKEKTRASRNVAKNINIIQSCSIT